ncbi:MAG: cadherin-like beta sandwich domain-containing protein [Tenericutes bacterium]|nr:cadherin-like beta sandwich domain-containing protein [Mycoplasmatota bacterium]
MKLKRITIIVGLILLLPLNIKALTAKLVCEDKKIYINSDVTCKLFINPEGSLISSFKADITYPNDIKLSGIQTSWIDSSTSNKIDMKMQTSTGNEGITSETEIATLKFKTTTSYGDKQIKLSGGDLSSVDISSIHVISNENRLNSLNVIGENIKFDKNTNIYELTTTKEKINIQAELVDTNARYEQNFGPREVSLNYGEQLINIIVIAESNEKNTYTLKVTRQDNRSTNDNLSNIVLSLGELSPKFSKDVLNYTVEVPNNASSLTITASLEDKKAEFVSGYGSRTVDLKLGENIILIQTQAEKGNTKTYTIKVNRNYKGDNNYLKSITLSSGTLNFDKDIFEYKINVDYNTKELLISAIAEEKTSTVEVVGNKELVVGENIYKIKVLAENKSERIYTIIVNRLEEGKTLSNNNYLANLSIKNHSIAFVKDKLTYDITLTNETSLDLKYDTEDEKAFVKVEGNSDLKNNSVVKIIVTAEDGTTRTYILNIIKEEAFNYTILIIPLAILLLGLVVIIVIKKVKPKKKEINPINEEIVKEKKLVLGENKTSPKKFKVRYKSLDDTLIVKDK